MFDLSVRRRGVSFTPGIRAFPADRMSSSIRGAFGGARRELEVMPGWLWAYMVDG
jgi:hypothetical protein